MENVEVKKVSADDVVADRRRGGEIKVLLSPRSVGSTSGFMGAGSLAPADRITEHYHPYSEEFMFVVNGSITATIDGTPLTVGAGEAVMVPKGIRHSLENTGTETAFAVFHTSPLAPRPDLGHVDTEAHVAEGPHVPIGGPGVGS